MEEVNEEETRKEAGVPDGTPLYFAGQVENEESHVTDAYSYKKDNEWVYVIIRWHYGTPFLLYTISGGRVTND